MVRALALARIANAGDRAAAVAERRPRLVLALLATAGLVLYVCVVPYALWPGWLPAPPTRTGTAPAMAPRDAVPGWPGAYAAAAAPLDVLAGLDANLTAVWTARDGPEATPPRPLYHAPGLTAQQRARYRHLRRPQLPVHTRATARDAQGKRVVSFPKYMFVGILKDVAAQLPDLLNTLAVVTQFLGPQRVSFSIVEGPSGDPTADVLEEVLRPLLRHLGVPDSAVRITTHAPRVDWGSVNRIEALAGLRNQALAPLWEDSDAKHRGDSTVGLQVAAVVYFNDVFLHAADVLELLHQHIVSSRSLGTGITAAWDWMTRQPAYFYDVWVARTMDGDLFYPINNAWWSPSDAILSTSPASRAAYDTLSPFQVFSAWNGMAVLNPVPFTSRGVRFRRSHQSRGECAASECSLLASDFWATNYGRVQVVPAVQLAYGRGDALASARALRETQLLLGWRNGVPLPQHDRPVVFDRQPPTKVRCHPWPEVHGLSANVWEHTEWVPPYVPDERSRRA